MRTNKMEAIEPPTSDALPDEYPTMKPTGLGDPFCNPKRSIRSRNRVNASVSAVASRESARDEKLARGRPQTRRSLLVPSEREPPAGETPACQKSSGHLATRRVPAAARIRGMKLLCEGSDAVRRRA
jgi:hypothetical protein